MRNIFLCIFAITKTLKMEKLELKHLAGYLPYGVKCRYQNKYNNIQICEIIGISNTELTPKNTGVQVELQNKNLITHYSKITGVKPILRPLSDLTKEIEVNGEKFIPMHKLLEYSETNYFSEDDNIKIKFNAKILSCDWNTYKYSKEQDAIIKYVERTSDGDLIYSLTYSSLLRRFVFRDETHRRPLGVGYQIDLFQKLYEWHFDIQGLIEKGLAININTLNSKP